jgi:methyl coenzyme M reductase alpha subunit
MKTIDTVIAHPQTNDQINALLAFMQALKIKFETKPEQHYNKEFVQSALEGKQQIKEGKVTRVGKENINDFLGL